MFIDPIIFIIACIIVLRLAPLRVKNKEWVNKSISHLSGYPFLLLVLSYLVAIAFKAYLIKKLITVFFIFYSFFIIKRHFFLFIFQSKHSIVLDQCEKLASILIYGNFALVVIYVLGVPMHIFIAGEWILGLAIGLAVKDVVANVFSAFTILITKPFSEGECIRSEVGFEGVVEEIGWFQTKLRTLDRRPLYIPNSVFLVSVIENVGRMYNRRINDCMYLLCGDIQKVPMILTKIENMLYAHKDIDQTIPPQIKLVGFYNNLLKLNIYAFTKTIDSKEYRAVQQDVFVKMTHIIESCDLKIALPHCTIQVQKLD